MNAILTPSPGSPKEAGINLNSPKELQERVYLEDLARKNFLEDLREYNSDIIDLERDQEAFVKKQLFHLFNNFFQSTMPNKGTDSDKSTGINFSKRSY